MSLAEAEATVRQRLASRPASFLRVLRENVFAAPASPYRAIFAAAGCTAADVEEMVAERGLEATLEALRAAGVFVAFEEFKGRAPIVRAGREIPVSPTSFDNPFLGQYYRGTTSGSTGAGTRISIDLDHIRATTPSGMLALAANGLAHAPTAIFRATLPSVAGMSSVLRSVVAGNPTRRWFSPLSRTDVRPSPLGRVATEYILSLGRLAGVPLPRPELVREEDLAMVARWAAQMVEEEGSCLVRSHVSNLLRVALAARDAGIDLAGVTLWGGGEPPTLAKVREITRSGARFRPTYYISELGAIGLPCARPASGDDLHLMADTLTVIQHPHPLPGSEVTVDALYYTALLPTAPRLMLNVESDDSGTLERRTCGCPLESYGFPLHVREIRSYRKLTGEGVTLLGSDMIRILEEVLPARFGGTPLDFQLVEEEDSGGFTRLVLRVHPRLTVLDEDEAVGALMDALGNGDANSDHTRAIWQKAHSLRVRREPPRWTAQGKFMPLVPLGSRAALSATPGNDEGSA
ncbi:MAG: hypothetical protein ACHQQS_13735 [Thermoanaerobaculales bacterium]